MARVRVIALLVAAAVGGVGGGVVWLVVNRLTRADGAGLLEQPGWTVPTLAAFALVGAAGTTWYVAARLRRLPVPDPDDPDDPDPPAALPSIPGFESLTDARLRTSVGGAKVYDATSFESDGDGGQVLVRRTVAVLPADGLPRFDLVPRTAGVRVLDWVAPGLTFDPSGLANPADAAAVRGFAGRYRLTAEPTVDLVAGDVAPAGTDEAAVRRAFSLGVLRLLAGRPGLTVRSDGGRLAVWRGTGFLPAAGRARLAADGRAVRAALAGAAAGGGKVIPAVPGTDRDRQAARLQATALGGIIGLLLGFTGSFAASSALFFSRPHAQRVADVGPGMTEMLVFFGGTILSAVLGAAIGSRLPLRRPLLRKVTDPRRARAVGRAGVVGLFGGFLAGPVAGVVLGEVVGLEIDDHAPRAALFFGGVWVGAIAGMVVLSAVVNQVYKWIWGAGPADGRLPAGKG